MSDLAKDVAEADKAIAGLGSQGQELLAAVARTGASLRSLSVNSLHEGAYHLLRNEFQLPYFTRLQKMFNLRVHEGVHACQFTALPAYIRAIHNMSDMEDDPRKRLIPAPETMLAVVDIAEAKAHAVQAAFNLMAARTYKDKTFITSFNLASMPPGFAALQLEALEDGREPEVLARDIALSLLDMPYESGENMQDTYHSRYLDSYLEYVMNCPSDVVTKTRLYELTPAAEQALVRAGGIYGFEQELLEKYRKPRLSLENARKLIDVRDCLPKNG